MSQGGGMENMANTREGQFGAIGTRRDQWQATAVTQPPLLSSSVSPGGPDATSTAGSSTTSTGQLLEMMYGVL